MREEIAQTIAQLTEQLRKNYGSEAVLRFEDGWFVVRSNDTAHVRVKRLSEILKLVQK